MMETETEKNGRGHGYNCAPNMDIRAAKPLKVSPNDCTNPVGLQCTSCISLNQGKCLHTGPCEPIDADGNRYTMTAVKDGGKTICYIRRPSIASLIDSETANAALSLMKAAKSISSPDIIDSDEMNKALVQVQTLLAKKTRPIIIAEEPVPRNPHQWFNDAIIAGTRKRKEAMLHEP